MRRKLAYLAVIFLATFAVAQQPAAPAPPAAHHGHAVQPAQPPDKIWSDLMDGNKRFVAGKLKPRAVVSVRESLTKSQHPKATVLSCSDSRVPPESVFDQTLGDLFVVRTAGNIAGPLGLASIEYGFDHLGSTVLVVLGHTKCGAVTAACSGEKMPTANLQAMVDQIDPAVKKMKGFRDGRRADRSSNQRKRAPERAGCAGAQRSFAARQRTRQVDGNRGGVSVGYRKSGPTGQARAVGTAWPGLPKSTPQQTTI